MKDSKFLYFRERSTFDNLVNNFPQYLSPLCFIEDTNEIWFNGHFFKAQKYSLRVSEMDNNVTVSLADSYFTIVPGSNSINITARGNSIMISCDALTKIDTDAYLEWKNQILSHKDSGVTEGSYGPSAGQSGASTFVIPRITVDQKGHITNAVDREIIIRDFVEQRKSDDKNAERNILLSEQEQDRDDNNITRKAKNLIYNNFDQTLKVQNLQIQGTKEQSVIVKTGDLIVEEGTIVGKLKGEVTGSATPKIHISESPDYGGASTNLYGHVKLVDTMPQNPQPSSDNSDTNNQMVDGKAASPYLVYNYVNAQKIRVSAIDQNNHTLDMSSQIDFSDDFVVKGSKLQIRWTEL